MAENAPLLINAGELRHTVTIERPTGARGASGAVEKEWEEFHGDYPAEIAPVSSQETFASDTFEAQTTHRITMRFLPGLTQQMRVVYGERTFDILGVVNVLERDFKLVLECREGRSKGN